MKKYNIILSDPPWSYNDKALAGNRGAECKYSVLSLEAIKNLPIYKLAADDCFLFQWATAPLMKDCIETVYSWGFEYKTIAFNWIKTYPKQTDKFFLGMGNYTRSCSEFLLLGVRGKLKRVAKNISSIVKHPILKPHSKKPTIIHEKIVSLCGDLPRIELFAREKQNGWDATGLELDETDIQDFLKKYDNTTNAIG